MDSAAKLRDENPIKEKRASCWIVFLPLSPTAPDLSLSLMLFIWRQSASLMLSYIMGKESAQEIKWKQPG